MLPHIHFVRRPHSHKTLAANPGATVTVRIEHDDRNELTIDWAAPPRARRRK
jgi:hypothetical protein